MKLYWVGIGEKQCLDCGSPEVILDGVLCKKCMAERLAERSMKDQRRVP